LRFYEGEAVLHENIWLEAARFAPLFAVVEERPNLLYPIYEEFCGAVVARAEETTTITKATAVDAEILAVKEGDPVVLIDRIALGFDNRPIEFRQSRGSASDFRYKVEIR